jgi:RNA-directed DNA polymerase
VNPAKTRVAGAGSRQRVLGAVVNTRPTLPRPERDALLHNCVRHSWTTQTRGHDPATFREHVLGQVAWAASLDPLFGERLQAMAARIDWS